MTEDVDNLNGYSMKEFGKDVVVCTAQVAAETIAAFAILAVIGYSYQKYNERKEKKNLNK